MTSKCTVLVTGSVAENLALRSPRRNLTDDVYRGAGYIGSFTSLALLEAGNKVIVVDSLYNASKVVLDRIELICGERPDFHEADITDEAALEKVFDKYTATGIDCVVHFAALKASSSRSPRLRSLADDGTRRWVSLRSVL